MTAGPARSASPPFAGVVANTQLVLREREARDRGWWELARDCFHPDSTVAISWFSGSGPDFVAASRRLTAAGENTTHRLGPPVVHLGGARAVVVLPMTLNSRPVVDGVDVTVGVRLLYRTERRRGRWRISAMSAIYERDALAPAVPGRSVPIAPGDLAGYRPSYRMLSWSFARQGIPVDQDLLGDDQPERVAAAYRDAFLWAGVPAPA
ncbi:nuclear transport factor 2 family protein [Micromonospora sp. NPDC093277]|uniref:nuclear transport factor 2 family protein n=1 Tax=Micromonospora sp. NPDC093277 TaxID=3364291 RepID=UPI00380CDE8E